MPQDPQTLRNNNIHAVLEALENYPINTKHPSVNSVAKKFRLPETTLRHAVKNRVSSCHQGPSTILTNHEENSLLVTVSTCKNLDLV